MPAPDAFKQVDPKLFDEVKSRFLALYEQNPKEYDECDIERVKTQEFAVRRFIVAAHENADESVKMLDNAMKWRKTTGINNQKETDWPLEFYKCGAFFPYEKDREGNIIIYMRIKMYKKISTKFNEVIRAYFLYVIDKVDKMTNGAGFSFMWDCSGVGLSNWDSSMIGFLISTLKYYFPRGLAYCLICYIPRVMTSFINLGLLLAPAEHRYKIKFAKNQEDIYNYVDRDKVPDFMEGTCTRSYTDVPEGAKPAESMAEEKGFTEDDINKIKKHYGAYIKELGLDIEL